MEASEMDDKQNVEEQQQEQQPSPQQQQPSPQQQQPSSQQQQPSPPPPPSQPSPPPPPPQPSPPPPPPPQHEEIPLSLALSLQLCSQLKIKTYSYPLLWNLHRLLAANVPAATSWITRGDFAYFHYGCDGLLDNGWGCAYRTLQSMCSWVLSARGSKAHPVPSIYEIQQTLVQIGDKPVQFAGSREWIGALEVCYVIDMLFDVPCKILHIPSRDDLKKYANVLKKYFEDFGGFVMMGGNVDAASKGIAGVQITNNQAYFLIVDPHYASVPKSPQELVERGFVRWQHTSEFVDSSFYNICLPQLKV